MEYKPDNAKQPDRVEGDESPTTWGEQPSSDAAQLVAYLDGELEPAEAAKVEQRLASDQTYREHLRQLQQSWDLLDALPRTSVNEEFTRSTVEMVAVSISQEVEKRKDHEAWKQRRRWIAAAVVSVLFAITGFAVVYERMTRANRQLMRDLPVIERVDLYREIDSIEFLQKLAGEGLFDEEQTDAP